MRSFNLRIRGPGMSRKERMALINASKRKAKRAVFWKQYAEKHPKQEGT